MAHQSAFGFHLTFSTLIYFGQNSNLGALGSSGTSSLSFGLDPAQEQLYLPNFQLPTTRNAQQHLAS